MITGSAASGSAISMSGCRNVIVRTVSACGLSRKRTSTSSYFLMQLHAVIIDAGGAHQLVDRRQIARFTAVR